MSIEKVEKGDWIKVVMKSDVYCEDYQIGDEFTVRDTWYGGASVVTALGVPVSLEQNE